MSDAPVIVARFSTVGEAESARSALEAAGIAAAIADDEMITLNWLYSNILGGVKVLVPEADREEALTILSDTAEAETIEAPPPQPSAYICRRCGSDEVYRIRYRRLLAIPLLYAILIVLLMPVLLLLPKWRCDRCGRKTWFRSFRS